MLVHNSIYAFRGADMRNIVEFEDAFPDTTVVLLEQNYRSTQTILDAANAVIANNVGPQAQGAVDRSGHRRPDRAVPRRRRGRRGPVDHPRGHPPPRLDRGGHRGRHRARRRLKWGDIAVFYRTNAQSRVLEEQLMRADIPYKVVGGTRFYDRREVKDAIAYLRAVVNPVDEVSLKRVLNEPKRGVGDTSIGKLDAWATAHGLSFMDALRRADDAGVSGKALRGIEAFLTLLDDVADLAAGSPGPLLQQLLERSGYLDQLEAERSIEAEGRLENLAELVGAANEAETVDEFLEQISLVADTDDLDDDATSVVLMTLHSAKGLEFPVVFLIGLEDGVFPHLRSLTEPDQLEEERRLAYVGITRARAPPVPDPRVEPHAVRRHAVQPAQPLPRRDPRRPGTRRRGPPAGQPRRTGLRRGRGRMAIRWVDGGRPRAAGGGGEGPHRRTGDRVVAQAVAQRG